MGVVLGEERLLQTGSQPARLEDAPGGLDADGWILNRSGHLCCSSIVTMKETLGSGDGYTGSQI
jgi:hypothetical protein